MQPVSLGRTRWHVRSRAPRLVLRADARYLVTGVGLATLVFGLLASVLLNLYLVAVDDPVVHQLRTVLSYRSAILGDGILLPVVNMAAASFLTRERQHLARTCVLPALLLGAVFTAYVHGMQAANQLVNWAMPIPWHWNAIGLWHALYMWAVTSWLVLFFFVVLKVTGRATDIPREARIVFGGVLTFLLVLHLDYPSVGLWLPFLR